MRIFNPRRAESRASLSKQTNCGRASGFLHRRTALERKKQMVDYAVFD